MYQLTSINGDMKYFAQMLGPKDKKGIVSEPVIDFVEPKDYIFPQLHYEIGAVNYIFDALRLASVCRRAFVVFMLLTLISSSTRARVQRTT
jgi:hypothetical protein